MQADSLAKQLALKARRFVRAGGDFSRVFRAFDVGGSGTYSIYLTYLSVYPTYYSPTYTVPGTVSRSQARKGLAKLGVRGGEAPTRQAIYLSIYLSNLLICLTYLLLTYLHPTRQELDSLFDRFDLDGDGVVSYR